MSNDTAKREASDRYDRALAPHLRAMIDFMAAPSDEGKRIEIAAWEAMQ